MTTNFQIDNYMKAHHVIGYDGVYGSDEIFRKYKKNSSIIVNYSPIGSKGSHWIGIRNINSKNPIEYFDSYGFPPDHDDKILGVKTRFREFIEKYNLSGKPYQHNAFDLQAYGSDVCGEYSCKFIMDGLPYFPNKIKNPKWNVILSFRTPEGRDKEVKNEIQIRTNKHNGYVGGELEKANAFVKHLDPYLQDNLTNDNSALLTLYYASLPYHQTNTTRRNVEMFKNLKMEEVGSGLDEINNKLFSNKMLKIDNWFPDKSYKIEHLLKTINPNNRYHQYLIENKKDIMKLYNNLYSNTYPFGTYNNFNIDREYNDFFNNYLHHYRKNPYF
tara:strand:- start:1938 stop:2924 length:987 start_codon:yes stop_codon:yes gene_type:complete